LNEDIGCVIAFNMPTADSLVQFIARVRKPLPTIKRYVLVGASRDLDKDVSDLAFKKKIWKHKHAIAKFSAQSFQGDKELLLAFCKNSKLSNTIIRNLEGSPTCNILDFTGVWYDELASKEVTNLKLYNDVLKNHNLIATVRYQKSKNQHNLGKSKLPLKEQLDTLLNEKYLGCTDKGVKFLLYDFLDCRTYVKNQRLRTLDDYLFAISLSSVVPNYEEISLLVSKSKRLNRFYGSSLQPKLWSTVHSIILDVVGSEEVLGNMVNAKMLGVKLADKFDMLLGMNLSKNFRTVTSWRSFKMLTDKYVIWEERKVRGLGRFYKVSGAYQDLLK
jgi:hypothetical protein